jgi:polyisoprenoid-binding protein YceI
MPTKPDHATTAPAVPALGRYEIDAGRSVIAFRTRHLFGLAPVRGTFTITSGTIDIAEPLADSAVRVQIGTASFRTSSTARDGVVRSARFLDSGRYSLITFASERLDGQSLDGTLTVRDISRPVRLSIERSEISPRSFTARGTVRIDRTEFGVTASRGMAGRYLDLVVDVHCERG